MENPFKSGSPISSDYFCNRKLEQKELLHYAESGNRVLLYSERRQGKTSLIMSVIKKLNKKDFIPVYVDLWSTFSNLDFIKKLAISLGTAHETSTDKILNNAKKFFAHLLPSVSIDSHGKAQLTLGIKSIKDNLSEEIERIIDLPQKIAEKKGKKIVLVFDEFQQIASYEDDRIERLLRSQIQFQDKVSYFFLGSRKSLIREMFFNSKRPLYRSSVHYHLNPIPKEEWIQFIRKRFKKIHKTIDKEIIYYICDIAGNHPFYIQYICQTIWSMYYPSNEVISINLDIVSDAIQNILDRQGYNYVQLWETFNQNQKKLLIGIVKNKGEISPYTMDFVVEYQLASTSSVQTALAGLFQRDVIDKENDRYIILDRFFALWIGENIQYP